MQNDKKQSIITNFICDEKKPSHIKKFNDGGLSRYSTISPIENVLSCMKKHLLHGSNNHYNAAKRLDIMLTGTNYDVFAIDVYYHKACYNRFMYEFCYNRFTYEYQKKTTVTSFNKTAIFNYFLQQTELKVIKDHEAFLVNELMQDIQKTGKGYGLEEPPAELRHSNRLKENLLPTLVRKFNLQHLKIKNVLHSSDVRPLTYTKATLNGHWLREDYIAKGFANLIRIERFQKKKLKKPADSNHQSYLNF